MEGGTREGARARGKKYWGKKNRFPWPHLKPQWLRVCLIFHNQSGLANPGLPHLLKGVFCCVFKVTETFQVSPCLPLSCFFFIFSPLGRKFLPQVFPLRTPVRSGFEDLASPSSSLGLRSSRAPLAPRSSQPPRVLGFLPPHSPAAPRWDAGRVRAPGD